MKFFKKIGLIALLAFLSLNAFGQNIELLNNKWNGACDSGINKPNEKECPMDDMIEVFELNLETGEGTLTVSEYRGEVKYQVAVLYTEEGTDAYLTLRPNTKPAKAKIIQLDEKMLIVRFEELGYDKYWSRRRY